MSEKPLFPFAPTQLAKPESEAAALRREIALCRGKLETERQLRRHSVSEAKYNELLLQHEMEISAFK